MTDENNGTETPAEPTPPEAEEKPFIHAEFNGELSAEINISMDRVSPMMLWGAAKMLEKYATDLWDQNRMHQMMEQQAEQITEQRSGIVPVSAMPQDHRRGRRN